MHKHVNRYVMMVVVTVMMMLTMAKARKIMAKFILIVDNT